jgi:hypothetical protein
VIRSRSGFSIKLETKLFLKLCGLDSIPNEVKTLFREVQNFVCEIG